jgi:hypothetical protein
MSLSPKSNHSALDGAIERPSSPTCKTCGYPHHNVYRDGGGPHVAWANCCLRDARRLDPHRLALEGEPLAQLDPDVVAASTYTVFLVDLHRLASLTDSPRYSSRAGGARAFPSTQLTRPVTVASFKQSKPSPIGFRQAIFGAVAPTMKFGRPTGFSLTAFSTTRIFRLQFSPFSTLPLRALISQRSVQLILPISLLSRASVFATYHWPPVSSFYPMTSFVAYSSSQPRLLNGSKSAASLLLKSRTRHSIDAGPSTFARPTRPAMSGGGVSASLASSNSS